MSKKSSLKPAEGWIHRRVPLANVQVKIPFEMKAEMVRAVVVLETSHNRFIEAAIARYLVELKKEGAI